MARKERPAGKKKRILKKLRHAAASPGTVRKMCRKYNGFLCGYSEILPQGQVCESQAEMCV